MLGGGGNGRWAIGDEDFLENLESAEVMMDYVTTGFRDGMGFDTIGGRVVVEVGMWMDVRARSSD